MNVNDTYSPWNVQRKKREKKRWNTHTHISYQVFTEFRLSTSFFVICSCETYKTIDYTHFTTNLNHQFSTKFSRKKARSHTHSHPNEVVKFLQRYKMVLSSKMKTTTTMHTSVDDNARFDSLLHEIHPRNDDCIC